MGDDLSTERTTVVATYPSRRDAEVARGRLDDEEIRSFITADDAGGAHTDFQWARGVKLVVLESEAWRAYEVLDDANMLVGSRTKPRRTSATDGADAHSQEGSRSEEQAKGAGFSLHDPVFVTITFVGLLLFAILVFFLVVSL